MTYFEYRGVQGMKRYENKPFWKFMNFGQKHGLTPCHFCQKVSFFNISWNNLQWHILNRQGSKRWKDMKISLFENSWILAKNDGLTPCHFCQKVSFFNISWNDLQWHILNRQGSKRWKDMKISLFENSWILAKNMG